MHVNSKPLISFLSLFLFSGPFIVSEDSAAAGKRRQKVVFREVQCPHLFFKLTFESLVESLRKLLSLNLQITYGRKVFRISTTRANPPVKKRDAPLDRTNQTLKVP